MNSWTNRLALLALLGVGVDQAGAQSRPPDAIKSVGTCVAIQTKATTVETPIGLRAEGSCAATPYRNAWPWGPAMHAPPSRMDR